MNIEKDKKKIIVIYILAVLTVMRLMTFLLKTDKSFFLTSVVRKNFIGPQKLFFKAKDSLVGMLELYRP